MVELRTTRSHHWQRPTSPSEGRAWRGVGGGNPPKRLGGFGLYAHVQSVGSGGGGHRGGFLRRRFFFGATVHLPAPLRHFLALGGKWGDVRGGKRQGPPTAPAVGGGEYKGEGCVRTLRPGCGKNFCPKPTSRGRGGTTPKGWSSTPVGTWKKTRGDAWFPKGGPGKVLRGIARGKNPLGRIGNTTQGSFHDGAATTQPGAGVGPAKNGGFSAVGARQHAIRGRFQAGGAVIRPPAQRRRRFSRSWGLGGGGKKNASCRSFWTGEGPGPSHSRKTPRFGRRAGRSSQCRG